MNLQKIRIIGLSLIGLIAFSIPTSLAQSKKKPKTVMVILDGVPADLLEQVATPNIDAISQEGAYTRAFLGGERGGYSETPTISAVGYNSMLTGTWSNKHNVFGNGIKNPNYHYWTIFRFLRESQPSSTLGIYSTWLDNRTKLLGAGLAQTNNLKIDYYADGYESDTVRFPHDNLSKYIHQIDEEVTSKAALSIREDAPDLSWVYLQYTDDMGHMFGDSEQMIDAIIKADRQVGQIYNALRYREQNFNEDWLIVVTTDHGRDVVTGSYHGSQSDRERTIWIATNHKELNKHFHASTPSIVDILPSVARHMNIELSKTQQFELDGVPFIREISIDDPRVSLKENNLHIEWTPYSHQGKVKVYVTASNNFRTGGLATPDNYESLGEYDIAARKADIPLPENLRYSRLLKVVIEGEHNTLNRWIQTDKIR